MIAIDTNILLRYLVEDEPEQAALAINLIENRLTADNPAFVALTVIVEIAWVLNRRYRIAPTEIGEIIKRLISAPQFVVERFALIERAIGSGHTDLADAIIHETGRKAGASKTLTFDHAFARFNGVELLGA